VVAVRVRVSGRVQGVFFRQTTQERARELGVMGWVRNEDDGSVLVHAEGPREAIEALAEFLQVGPEKARVDAAEVEQVKVEGHEQFAIRGVPAGEFSVLERGGEGDGAASYELRLEVDGGLRAWRLAKAPSMDPAVKRLAIPVEAPDESGATIWDRGPYEQGGRVAWPEAIERGHAVFVLHGERLRGGFALQRTGKGDDPRWLLIKRRDAHAQTGP
jgi:acylphosphatase